MTVGSSTGGQKIIDIKPARSRKKKIILGLKFAAVIIWLLLIAGLADKYYYHYLIKPKPAAVLNQPVVQEEVQPVVGTEKPVAVNAGSSTQAAVQNAPVDLSGVEKRLNNLEAANRNLFAYFAARDLKDSLDEPDNFKEQVEFLKKAMVSDLNVSGKIDILEQATSNGLVTRAKLLGDLETLQKHMDAANNHGFSGNIKAAFGNLIKVTKTEGEVEATDYNSIIKRAELVLAKPKISSGELLDIINEVKKLGKTGDGVVREANNLARVLEVTDYLVIYTKSKTLENNG